MPCLRARRSACLAFTRAFRHIGADDSCTSSHDSFQRTRYVRAGRQSLDRARCPEVFAGNPAALVRILVKRIAPSGTICGPGPKWRSKHGGRIAGILLLRR